jgi:ElaB/YqjD/DUF883 family membrane-anchored ribosome-binding protein
MSAKTFLLRERRAIVNGIERQSAREDTPMTGVSEVLQPEGTDSLGDADVELEHLKASIRDTEQEMVEALKAIQEKLSIESILKQTGERARDAVVRRIEIMASRLSESGRNIGSETVDTIKQHPGTAAVIGMGLGFLLVSSLWNRSSGKEGEHQETYTGIARGDAEHVMHPEQGRRGSVFLEDDRSDEQGESEWTAQETTEAPGRTHEKSHRILENLGERATEIGSMARHTARSTQDRASRLVDEKPLIVGVAALAAGVAMGMMCSGAFRERGFAKEARESIRRKTLGFVEGAKDKAERVVQEAGAAAKEEAERQHMILPEQSS